MVAKVDGDSALVYFRFRFRFCSRSDQKADRESKNNERKEIRSVWIEHTW